MQTIQNEENLPQGKNSILELKKVSKVFKNDLIKGKQIALNQINFKFFQGECTGLLGHNGAGKTTAIRTILGIIFPDSGEICFNGNPLTRKDRAKIGYMPEINKLPLNLTPIELLRSHLKIYSVGKNKQINHEENCKNLLQTIGLWDHKNKKIKNMSKGMARRIAWALAVIHEPQLLILDEPFSGLDPLGRNEMNKWIEDAKAKGISIILCTHELSTVQHLCDNFHILNRGKLVYSTHSQENNEESTANYELSISGITEDKLSQHLISQKLPEWNYISQEGWLTKLYFREYEDAIKWVKICTDYGYLILNFSSNNTVQENKLLKFFEIKDVS